MKIAVLLGGSSPEREVSLKSGKNIADALRKNGHQIIEFDPSISPEIQAKKLVIDAPDISDFGSGLYMNLLLLKRVKIDLVFNGLHGGDGENGVVQTLLDTLGIKYTGPGAMACMLAMDKEISKILLLQNGLPTAKSITIRNVKDSLPALGKMSFPLIVKPADGGSSLGHTVLENSSGIRDAVIFAFKNGQKVLIEEFIKGKEIAASVLNGIPLPLVQIIPKHDIYDYECKYTPGMSSYQVPADLADTTTKIIQGYATKMYNFFGCVSYARIDFLVKDNGKMVILEMNTLPGMTSTSLVPKAAKEVGLSFEDLIENIAQEVVKR